ncbi:hypothetical protein JCM16303_001378 [Sporobolomyces ruberrimus]
MQPSSTNENYPEVSATEQDRGDASGSTAPQAGPGIDFSQLRLKRMIWPKEEEEAEEGEKIETGEDEDSEEDEDTELDDECKWLRQVVYYILGPDSSTPASFVFCSSTSRASVTISTTGWTGPVVNECMSFSQALFTRKGFFKSKFRREGNSAWGPEVNQSKLFYLERFDIVEEERGKGIGSWALRKIWKIRENRTVDGLEDMEFLFVIPTNVPSREDQDWWRGEHTEVEIAAREAVNAIEEEMVISFYRKAKFRRVGHTIWFCCSRDPSHRSRGIPIDADAPQIGPRDCGSSIVVALANSL